MNELSSDGLERAGRQLVAPLRIRVIDPHSASGTAQVQIDEVLRLVPGKRLVGRALWQGTPAVAKLFFQPGRWQTHLARELSGQQIMADAAVPTPARLFSGRLADGNSAVVLTAYVTGATSALDGSEDPSRDFQPLMARLLPLIAVCHRHGFWQDDIHLDNFLLGGDATWLLDPASIRTQNLGKPLDMATRQANLALLFAQFPVQRDRELEACLSLYDGEGAWPPMDPAALRAGVAKARGERLRRYRRKMLRSTTSHRAERTRAHFLVADRSLSDEEVRAFASRPDQYVESGILLKAGNTSTVAAVQLGSRRLLVKRYNIKGFWHGVTRLLVRSRARNSWCAAQMLRMLGVETPRPWLMLERRGFWLFRRQSYFVSDLAEGDSVASLLEQPQPDTSRARQIFARFRDLLRLLAEYRISHGDFKATNFFLAGDRLVVLDLDAVRLHRGNSRFRKAFARDIERFLKNWKGRQELQDMAAQAVRELDWQQRDR